MYKLKIIHVRELKAMKMNGEGEGKYSGLQRYKVSAGRVVRIMTLEKKYM